MSDHLTASPDRLDEVTIMLAQLGQDARARLMAAVAGEALTMLGVIKDEKLTGQVLNQRSGDLRNDIHVTMQDDASGIMAVIGSRLPYAAIHEYGGVIVPKDATALRFFIDGRMIITKSVTMPERSYLRSTLAERQDEIRAALTAAVAGVE